MVNPVFGTRLSKNISNGDQGNGDQGSGGGGGEISITLLELESLRTIQTLYTSQLANRNYANIPVDLTKYLKLREIASTAQTKYKSNAALAVLFQITVDGITGTINTYGLNTLNIETQVQNAYLQGVIEEIISGINVTKAFDENVGTLSMSKTFELAPLFRYYISLYGVPEIGVGFDPVKLALVLTALQNSGIDPYK
jgi:hypothetical protein